MKEPKIVFEDSDILVLDKPAGIVVDRAATVKERTIQDWVEKKLKISNKNSRQKGEQAKLKDFYRRTGIVHRLDKETSGLLLVAKTAEAFENLQKQFKERRVGKKYLALVHGKVEPKEGVIRASIGRSPFDRKKFGVFLGGKEAKTRYKVLGIKYKASAEKKDFYSLLEIRPETGRTHQIRVHLKHIGHPVVSDPKYAGRKNARLDRQWCPRQFLHANFLTFTHPRSGKKVKFTSLLPRELKRALVFLGHENEETKAKR